MVSGRYLGDCDKSAPRRSYTYRQVKTASWTNEADVRALVDDLKNAPKVVIHLHGGLVSKSNALEKAERLLPAYQAAGARPVFMVWESGFFETIKNNLHEINKEEVFAILVKLVLKYSVGKLTDIDGAKASGQLVLPTDIEVAKEFNKRLRDEVPFADVEAEPKLKELNEAERKRFEDALAADPDFQNEVHAVINGASPEMEKKETTSKGVTALHRKSSKTLMSPEVVDELVADAEEKDGKGILSTAGLVLKAGRILSRVISRHLAQRDHGLYTTVVEEVLREFYLANAGSVVWGMIKQDTVDTFANFGNPPTRAGWFFAQELGKLLKEGHQAEISVVAHSAGAIYASHLLKHLDWARGDHSHPLPHDFKLKNLIFLAPACSFTLFDEVLERHKQAALFDHFRHFALKDKLEAGYWEVSGVYPRSLLYLVSGVVEKEADKSASDFPILGMERYFTKAEVYEQPEIQRVRQFFMQVTDKRSEVWSEADRGSGLVSDAIRHGGFDSTEERAKTIASIQQILKTGW